MIGYDGGQRSRLEHQASHWNSAFIVNRYHLCMFSIMQANALTYCKITLTYRESGWCFLSWRICAQLLYVKSSSVVAKLRFEKGLWSQMESLQYHLEISAEVSVRSLLWDAGLRPQWTYGTLLHGVDHQQLEWSLPDRCLIPPKLNWVWVAIELMQIKDKVGVIQIQKSLCYLFIDLNLIGCTRSRAVMCKFMVRLT